VSDSSVFGGSTVASSFIPATAHRRRIVYGTGGSKGDGGYRHHQQHDDDDQHQMMLLGQGGSRVHSDGGVRTTQTTAGGMTSRGDKHQSSLSWGDGGAAGLQTNKLMSFRSKSQDDVCAAMRRSNVSVICC
jgi:hypothetical protein